MTGLIRNIIPKKNFGFIEGEDGKEYFFHRDNFHGHWDDLLSDHEKGHKIKVEFAPESSPKGKRAGNISRLDHPNQYPG